jgi:thiamine-monophosphate kinase
MLEQIHFLPNDAPDLIARKLLRRNLSDLAAMGATPLGYLLTVALTQAVDEAWLQGFAKGLALDQTEFGITLFGGDTSSSRGGIALSATLIGQAAPGAALSRNGAKPGDAIWVTGTIGDAALGLRARLGKLEDKTGFLVQRSLLPSPRLGLALAGIANAAIDISDGLVQDLGHMCKGAALRAVIRAGLIPASPEAAALGPDYLEARLTEGDDYELLLAVPPGKGGALKAACNGLPITKIGMFQAGTGVHVLADDGTLMSFAKGGWEHF